VKTKLEIAVDALRFNRDEAESQLSTGAPRQQAWERVLRDANRALAAMKDEPAPTPLETTRDCDPTY